MVQEVQSYYLDASLQHKVAQGAAAAAAAAAGSLAWHGMVALAYFAGVCVEEHNTYIVERQELVCSRLPFFVTHACMIIGEVGTWPSCRDLRGLCALHCCILGSSSGYCQRFGVKISTHIHSTCLCVCCVGLCQYAAGFSKVFTAMFARTCLHLISQAWQSCC
jgi:hypothetical protein